MIRAYEPSDHPRCRELWLELTDHHRELYALPGLGGDDPGAAFDVYLADPARAGTWVFVESDESDGLVVGFVGLLLHGTVGELEPVVVSRDRRSEGIGRQLIEHVIAEASARGLGSLTLRPAARNESAMRVFHALGFRTVRQIELGMDLSGPAPDRRPGIDLHGLPYSS